MVERIIELCARHRALVLIAVALAVVGAVVAIRHAKVDAIPDLSDPQVIVFSEWMGRSPTLLSRLRNCRKGADESSAPFQF